MIPERGECHIWTAPVSPTPGRPSVLDDREHRQAGRLGPTRAAAVFVTSRTLQRVAGSAYLGVPPSRVEVTRDCLVCGRPDSGARPHGRPRFRIAPADHPVVDFSVSHTGDWVLLAAVAAGHVGLDLETLDSPLDPGELAQAIFSPQEQEAFRRVPPGGRAAWVLTRWTRKEAAMKLTGLGLRAAPGQVDVSGATVRARAPGWPAEVIHLAPLPAPGGHVATLATTIPVTTTRWFTLDSYHGREAQHGDPSPDAVPA